MRDKRFLFLLPLVALSLVAGWRTLFWSPRHINPAQNAVDTAAPAITQEDLSKKIQTLLDSLEQDTPKPAPRPAIKVQFPELQLLGTIVAQTKDPLAFIREMESGKQGTYRIGSAIQGARIISISTGDVVIEMDGVTKNLRMSARANRSSGPEGAPVDFIVSMTEDRVVVSKQGLSRAAPAIADAIRTISIKPLYEAQQVTGMIVDNIPAESVIGAMGIRNKDIVTTVNNQRLDSYQKALQIAQKARSQSEITVNLMRDGKEKTVSYRFAP